MRAKEFLTADEQVAFIKFMFDSTWAQIKKNWKEEREREEGRKSAELASKRASVVKRNRATQPKSNRKRAAASRSKHTISQRPISPTPSTADTRKDEVSISDTGRPQRGDPAVLGD
jgi:hypothetical protein